MGFEKLRKNLVYILADSPVSPSGGLGERISRMLPRLEENFNIFAYCAGKGGKVSNTVCHEIEINAPNFGSSYSYFLVNYLIDNPPPFKPDIVLCTDHTTIIASKAFAAIHGAKLVTEFNLAYYSMRKIIKESELVGGQNLDQAAKQIYMTEEIGATSSDLVIGCSDSYVGDLPWKVKKAVSIQNGVEFEQFTIPHQPYNFPGGKKRNIVFIGRINAQKGVKHLLDFYKTFVNDLHQAVVRVPDEFRLQLPEDTALHFVGGPVGSDQFEALIETVKRSKQKFHIPFVSGQDKINLLKSADAILFPSLHEPFGIVGLEAFAAGVPLITTAVDGISDYANDANCIRCEPSAISIRASIDRLYSMSAEEVSEMVRKGRETAKQFSWDVITAKLTETLNML